jgi:hypothetical protein
LGPIPNPQSPIPNPPIAQVTIVIEKTIYIKIHNSYNFYTPNHI